MGFIFQKKKKVVRPTFSAHAVKASHMGNFIKREKKREKFGPKQGSRVVMDVF
jgi:hypothetical protein